MSASQICVRYAKSLFNLAQKSNSVEDIHAALVSMAGLLKAIPSLREFVHNPLIGVNERNKVLSSVFLSRVPDLLMKFLLFISIKNRLDLLEGIIRSFDGIYLKSQNKVRADIITALDIGDEAKKNVLDALGRVYNKTIVPDWQLSASLIGGFKIFIEGRLHDSSFISQLEEYKQSVLK